MVMYWLLSYLVGNFMTAWWVGKWKKVDLRLKKSGNLGARNAGAVIGKAAFFITFFGDALKGVIIIYAGFLLNHSDWVIGIGGLIVILGHIFPIWLKGKGGKGISTFIGVGIVFYPLLFISFVIGIGLSLPFLRSATLSMIVGYIAYILWAIYSGAWAYAWPIIIAIVVILYRHRFDINESWNSSNIIRKQ